MEAIFFAVDIVGIVLVLYWAIINDDRKPGSPTTGLFAYREFLHRRPPSNAGRTTAAAGRAATTSSRRPPPLNR
jgi:hypothetical protein